MELGMNQDGMFNATPTTLQDVAISKIGGLDSKVTSATNKGMKLLGFTSAVLLKEVEPYDEDGITKYYKIVDGLGRVNDAVNLKLSSVPAIILDKTLNEIDEQMLRASMNLNRRYNVVQEALALKAVKDKCVEQGMNQGDIIPYISRSSGINAATVEKRLKLFEVPDKIRQAAFEGLIKPTIISKIANLKPAQQQELVSVLEKTGKLTATDISQTRTVSNETIVAALPFELFGSDDHEVTRVGVVKERPDTALLGVQESGVSYAPSSEPLSQTFEQWSDQTLTDILISAYEQGYTHRKFRELVKNAYGLFKASQGVVDQEDGVGV
jgi:DNA-directed RNA polymerase subunit F